MSKRKSERTDSKTKQKRKKGKNRKEGGSRGKKHIQLQIIMQRSKGLGK